MRRHRPPLGLLPGILDPLQFHHPLLEPHDPALYLESKLNSLLVSTFFHLDSMQTKRTFTLYGGLIVLRCPGSPHNCSSLLDLLVFRQHRPSPAPWGGLAPDMTNALLSLVYLAAAPE